MTRSLLYSHFKYASTAVHGKRREPGDEGYYALVILPLTDEYKARFEDSPLLDWLFLYKVEDDSDTTPFKLGIYPGSETLLQDAEVRKRLASEGEKFFLKTHSLPFEDYYPGERVIQIVRHPGAVHWSYFDKYYRQYKQNGAIDLETVIRGGADFGNWSEYHLAWNAAGLLLGKDMLRVRYEDVADSPREYSAQLSAFIQTQILDSELKPIEYFHARRPGLPQQSAQHEWRDKMTQDNLDDLVKYHGDMMAVFGYEAGDL